MSDETVVPTPTTPAIEIANSLKELVAEVKLIRASLVKEVKESPKK